MSTVAGSGHFRRFFSDRVHGVECHEFNVFVGANSATPAQTMHNWTMFRKLLDQVFGFDVRPAGGAVVGTASGTYADLEFGDFFTMDVVPIQEISSMINASYRADIHPFFTVHPAFGTTVPPATGSATYFRNDAFAVRNSANLRVNLEYAVKSDPTNLPPGDFDGSVTPYVYIRRPGTSVWVPVQMVAQTSPGVSPVKGERWVLTGMVSNLRNSTNDPSGALVDWVPGAPTGTVELIVRLVAQVPFVAHFDLVQVVGVDANDSALDWDHNGVVNGQDLMAFVDDFVTLWTSNGGHPIASTLGLSALDSDNSGYVTPSDLCHFYDRLQAIGALTSADCSAFNTRIHSLGFICAPEHGCYNGD